MKKYHFVYKTNCILTNHYYLGVHSTNNREDGYLGSGIKLLNYVKKYGRSNFTREIVKTFETREEAFEYEKQILTESTLTDKMCLNVAVGGIGYKHKYGETFKTRISETKRRKLASGEIVPIKHTAEWKQKLRQNNPGGKATAKPIYQIGTDGEVVNVWESARRAATSLDINLGNISGCAGRNKQRRTGGYFWRWVGDPKVIDDKLTDIHELLNHLQQPHNPHGVKGKPK